MSSFIGTVALSRMIDRHVMMQKDRNYLGFYYMNIITTHDH